MLDPDFKKPPFVVNNYDFLQTDLVNVWVESPLMRRDERYWCVYDDFNVIHTHHLIESMCRIFVNTAIQPFCLKNNINAIFKNDMVQYYDSVKHHFTFEDVINKFSYTIRIVQYSKFMLECKIRWGDFNLCIRQDDDSVKQENLTKTISKFNNCCWIEFIVELHDLIQKCNKIKF